MDYALTTLIIMFVVTLAFADEMKGGHSGRRYSHAGSWEATMHGRYGGGMGGYDEGGSSYVANIPGVTLSVLITAVTAWAAEIADTATRTRKVK